MPRETLTLPRQDIADSLIADIHELEDRHQEDLPVGEYAVEIDPRLLASIEGEEQQAEVPEKAPEVAPQYSQWVATETRQFHTEVDERAAAFETRYAGESPEVATARHKLELEMLSFEERAHVKREDAPKSQELSAEMPESAVDEKVAPPEEQFHHMEQQELITESSFEGTTFFTPTELQEMYLTEYKRLRKLKSFEGAWQHFEQPDGRGNDLEYSGYEKNPEAYLISAQRGVEEQLTVAEIYTETHHQYGNQAFEKFEERLYEKFGREGVTFDYRTSEGEKLTQWRPGVKTTIKQGEDGIMHIGFDYDDQVAQTMYNHVTLEDKHEQKK